MTTEHEIIDETLYRAILHGIAAGACTVAARETRSAYWAGMAADQRGKAKVLLHQAAAGSADGPSAKNMSADRSLPSDCALTSNARWCRAGTKPPVPPRSLS